MSDDPTQSTPVQPIWAAPATPPIEPAPAAAAPPIAPAAGPAIEPVRPVVTAPAARRRAAGSTLLGVAAAVAIGGIAFAVGRSSPVAAAGFNRGLGNGGNFVPTVFDPNASFAPGRGRQRRTVWRRRPDRRGHRHVRHERHPDAHDRRRPHDRGQARRRHRLSPAGRRIGIRRHDREQGLRPARPRGPCPGQRRPGRQRRRERADRDRLRRDGHPVSEGVG